MTRTLQSVATLTLLLGAVQALATEPLRASPGPSGCFTYQPTLVELSGSLSAESFPSAPGNDESPSEERTESVYVLTLDKPICTRNETGGDTDSESGVTTLQVESKKVSQHKLKSYSGRQVLVKGMLFRAQTAHHHTRVVLTIQSIKRP
ncbi:MAG: DUF4431 domain-containing protein [Steroidobacteraceae bacterium]